MKSNVYGVGSGFPGSIDFSVWGVCETVEEAADVAVQAVDMMYENGLYFPGCNPNRDWWLDHLSSQLVIRRKSGVLAYAFRRDTNRCVEYVEARCLLRNSAEHLEWLIAEKYDAGEPFGQPTENFRTADNGELILTRPGTVR